MRPVDALKCATWNGAWYIGMDRDLGSIERGKLADFVVLDRDPRADIRNSNSVKWTIKNGEVYDGEYAGAADRAKHSRLLRASARKNASARSARSARRYFFAASRSTTVVTGWISQRVPRGSSLSGSGSW